MTSRKSFFDLLREDFRRRLWSFAISVLTFFFFYPVAVSRFLSNVRSRDFYGWLEGPALEAVRVRAFWYNFSQWLSPQGTVNPFALMVITALAVLMSLSGFSYLFRKGDVDFYHSLPIRRSRYFLAITLNSWLMTMVPLLVMSTIAGVIAFGFTGRKYVLVILLKLFAAQGASFFLIHAVASTALMLAGTLPVALIAEAVFFGYLPLAVYTADSYFQSFLKTYWTDAVRVSALATHTSPVTYALTDGALLSRCLWSLFFGLLFCLAALLLYRKRPSEAAGRAIAFRKSEWVIKFFVVLLCTLSGGILMYSIQSTIGWTVFGLLTGLLLSSCVIEIIFRSDFKRLFDRKGVTAACAVLSLFVLFACRFDIFGYDSYLPDPEKLQGAGLWANDIDSISAYNNTIAVTEDRFTGEPNYHVEYNGDNDSIITTMNVTDKDLICDLAGDGIRALPELTGFRASSAQQPYTRLFVVYHLADGRDVRRSYLIPLQDVQDDLDRLADNMEAKQSVYPLLSFREEDLSGINIQTSMGIKHVAFSDREEMLELFSVYTEEFRNLSARTRHLENPVACLQFKSYEFQAMADRARADKVQMHSFNQVGFYPVYPSFAKTTALLADLGFDLSERFPADRVKTLTVSGPVGNSYYDSLQVTDPEQIREILSGSWCANLSCNNSFCPVYHPIDISVTAAVEGADPEEAALLDMAITPDGYIVNALFHFTPDEIPDYVRDFFQLSEEELAQYPAGY